MVKIRPAFKSIIMIFELSDKHVSVYNDWVEARADAADLIKKWLEEHSEQVTNFSATYGKDFVPKVILWSDRKKTDYFKEKLQLSLGFENYIEKLVKVKYDLDLDPYNK